MSERTHYSSLDNRVCVFFESLLHFRAPHITATGKVCLRSAKLIRLFSNSKPGKKSNKSVRYDKIRRDIRRRPLNKVELTRGSLRRAL